MQLQQVLALGLLWGLTSLAYATPLSYTFTTSGSDPVYSSSYAVGSGALTVDALPGTGSTVSAFTYTLTESASGIPTVQTTFSLNDITGFQSTVDGAATDPVLTGFSLTGQTSNGAFFLLDFNGPSQGRFDAYYAGSPGDPQVGSEGIVAYTPLSAASSAVTPEPASVLLLASGLLGLGWAVRKRAHQA